MPKAAAAAATIKNFMAELLNSPHYAVSLECDSTYESWLKVLFTAVFPLELQASNPLSTHQRRVAGSVSVPVTSLFGMRVRLR